ncbi:histidine phosphatase family protein [Thioclava sp. 'Guangxiensis']|uniref:histidine phosphatase family protein n=1 Tax=Thioclava sp. 'Guangxiensis' TaxID=3149044 RepID=UPI0038783B88
MSITQPSALPPPEDGPQCELVLIRHAPVIGDGCVYGRRDLRADLADRAALARVAEAVPEPARIVASPALRCVQTARALWPDLPIGTEPDFWEQDLGEWEGRPYAELPDLGPLPLEVLAAHRPPGGESFLDLCARVPRGLAPLSGRVTVLAHAGTIRAVLGLALEVPAAGLRFEIAPLSLTRVSFLFGGAVIHEVNRCV